MCQLAGVRVQFGYCGNVALEFGALQICSEGSFPSAFWLGTISIVAMWAFLAVMAAVTAVMYSGVPGFRGELSVGSSTRLKTAGWPSGCTPVGSPFGPP